MHFKFFTRQIVKTSGFFLFALFALTTAVYAVSWSSGAAPQAQPGSGNVQLPWSASGGNVFRVGGNVGIGVSPSRKLDVLGRLLVREGNLTSNWETADWGALTSLRRAGASNMAGASAGNAQLELVSNGVGTAHISFHRPGVYGANFGLDSDKWFSTQGWSAGAGFTSMRVGSFQANGTALVNYLQINPQNSADEGGELQLKGSGSYPALQIDNYQGNARIHTLTSGKMLQILGGSGVKATAFYYSSDRSLKKNIQPVNNALAKIQALEGVNFRWQENDKESLGLIAQDVEKVFPELVSTDEETGLKSVQYGNLVAPLIEAVKAQQKQIQELQQQIKKLTK